MQTDNEYNQQDPLYDCAVKHVREENRATITYLQRKLRIGFNRAARLIETMEEQGVITGIDSRGGRKVLDY